MKKQFAVFGLGSFGESVAVTLQQLGCEVVAVDNHMQFAMLLLTDVINATSEVFVAGPRPDYVETAFKIDLVEQQASLPGVISRKKQVVPVITDVLTQ